MSLTIDQINALQAENERLRTQRDIAREQAERWVAKLEQLEAVARKASIIIRYIVAEGWEPPGISLRIPNESLTHADLEATLAEQGDADVR